MSRRSPFATLRILLTVAIFTTASLFSPPTPAADPQGRFGIKGPGATTCSTFVDAIRRRTENAYLYGGWVYGYLTSFNQFAPDTFDVAPWEDLETLVDYLVAHCERQPDQSFAQAVFQLAEALKVSRLTVPSTVIEATSGGNRVRIYEAVLRRAQEALVARGHLAADGVTGMYDEPTRAALTAFQTAARLTVTGLPDRFTLHQLLRR
ncbi:MAG: peptidoglycan-binding protein [Ectothiorhodospiraceae bacterium]|nr:peptidoglycan-binding protein [Ectothiorhodospiraceae bacterium]